MELTYLSPRFRRTVPKSGYIGDKKLISQCRAFSSEMTSEHLRGIVIRTAMAMTCTWTMEMQIEIIRIKIDVQKEVQSILHNVEKHGQNSSEDRRG